jgi:hypothetical protein
MSAEQTALTSSAGQARGEALAQQTHQEHTALLSAIHQLEAALASAGPGREQDWNRRVIETLQVVSDILVQSINLLASRRSRGFAYLDDGAAAVAGVDSSMALHGRP